MINHRILVGFSLAGVVLTCLYFGCINILYIGINMAVIYDVAYMKYVLNINLFTTSIFFLIMELYNYWLLNFYNMDVYLLVKIITIAQVGDVYQYLAGTYLGRNKIGWISKNKTYEGYIVGWLLTVGTYGLWLCFFSVGQNMYLINCNETIDHINTFDMNKGFYEVTTIYLLSVISGLCSSLFKRIIDIKDYSNLLGPHGGWIDRIDSIVLPSIVVWLKH
jgi:phosphatidate cytidylyltransferase